MENNRVQWYSLKKDKLQMLAMEPKLQIQEFTNQICPNQNLGQLRDRPTLPPNFNLFPELRTWTKRDKMYKEQILCHKLKWRDK